MSTEKHYHGIESVNYPVGRNLTRDLEKINLLAEEFIKFYASSPFTPQIIARGSSGILVGGQIAVKYFERTGKHIVVNVLRKSNQHHGYGDFKHFLRKGKETNSPLVIVDDFIGSGDTMKAIYEEIEKACSATSPTETSYDPTVDCIFVTGSRSVDKDECFPNMKLNHLFTE